MDKLQKAQRTLADQQLKFKGMQSEKVKGWGSIETRMFDVLKEIRVELSSYHGGSLNGKDIKKLQTMPLTCSIRQQIYLKRGRGPTAL